MPKFMVNARSYRPKHLYERNENGELEQLPMPPKTYYWRGMVLETPLELDKKFDNAFLRVGDEQPVSAPEPPPSAEESVPIFK